MTTETSNARGEVVAWEARDPVDGTRWVTRHASERDGWMGLGRTIRPLIYGDAPPPAATRGDVRGLVAKWRAEAERARANAGRAYRRGDLNDQEVQLSTAQDAEAYADELEAALAAEGVQAGEVERIRAALRDALAYVGQRTDGDLPTLAERCELWMRESHSLIENPVPKPEARGVVVPERLRRFVEMMDAKPLRGTQDNFYSIHTGTEWAAELRLSDLRSLTAALTEARDVR